MLCEYNYIDLFHGIGGFALGAYWAGMKFKNHFCSDIEPYCQKLYKLRFPDSIQLGDITKIDTEDLKQYGDKWIITGGFPCQPFSRAGKQQGEEDRRNMWPAAIGIIRDVRPAWAILENVNGATRYIDERVLPDLEKEDYAFEPVMFPASAINGGHERKRWWIVAYPKSFRYRRSPGQKCCKNEQFMEPREHERYPLWRETERRIICNIRNQEAIPDYLRDNYGLSDWVDRLKGLGNAIVPQIAELLFNQIKPLLHEQKKEEEEYDRII